MSRMKEIRQRRSKDATKWAVEDRSFLLAELEDALALLRRVENETRMVELAQSGWYKDCNIFLANLDGDEYD